MGFFNVPVAAEKHYGKDKENIDIILGNTKSVIHGHINRSVNKTYSPRIMGGVELRNWFQKNFEINQLLEVSIINPTKIKITRYED
jgi:hypothetical protein